jgi:hypothetical protein
MYITELLEIAAWIAAGEALLEARCSQSASGLTLCSRARIAFYFHIHGRRGF